MSETESPDSQPSPLPAEPAEHSGIQRDEALQALVQAVRAAHGDAVRAVLFYGSCLRSGDPATGIADFYVVVSAYRAARMAPVAALMNRLLPPNVFYLEAPLRGHILRAKYAVVRRDQFIAGTRGDWFLPYLWGRFAQPSQIAWCADKELQQQLQQALTRARHVFLRRTAQALHGRFTVTELWQQALLMSYHTELRAERLDKIRNLVYADPDYYHATTIPCLVDLPWFQLSNHPAPTADGVTFELQPPVWQRRYQRFLWLLRSITGKLVSVARLFKSLFTFSGAVDYAVWKIQRHSGQAVEVPGWARRYPWIGGWVVLWRLWRKGQLK